jgi:ER membrane protein complex subunit 8/9
MSGQKYSVSDLAYLKIVLHASKHPHAVVNGVLVTQTAALKSNEMLISDAIPLLHHWTNLSPMMELGLDLVRRFYLRCAGEGR